MAAIDDDRKEEIPDHATSFRSPSSLLALDLQHIKSSTSIVQAPEELPVDLFPLSPTWPDRKPIASLVEIVSCQHSHQVRSVSPKLTKKRLFSRRNIRKLSVPWLGHE